MAEVLMRLMALATSPHHERQLRSLAADWGMAGSSGRAAVGSHGISGQGGRQRQKPFCSYTLKVNNS